MCGTAILFLSFILYERAYSTYSDQRQTGDLNVQIDLKNLQVIALMKGKEEYVDYDYAYDYSDITIKPQNGTTKKPLNVTEASTEPNKNNTTTVSSIPELITTLSTSYNNVTMIENDPGFKSTTFPTTTLEVSNNNNSNIAVETTTNVETLNATLLTDNCKKGFVRNSNGTCEHILQNPTNTLLKMLKQKSRPRNGLRKA